MYYLDRLVTPYYCYIDNDRKIKRFYDQFKKGSGGELNDKFWKPNSSSRLCFDLYSCLAEKKQVRDIEFEYQLPPIYSGGRKCSPPNMDVYIETDDYIVFIESKLTETKNNINYGNYEKTDSLPQAYYREYKDGSYFSNGGKKKIENCSIKERYNVAYKKAKNKKIENCDIKTSLKFIEGETERQKKQLEKMRDMFPVFCGKVSKHIKNHKDKILKDDWFDAKQETCHIFGILLYAITYQPTKKIHFYNIVFDKRKTSDLAIEFVKLANDLFRNVLGGGKVSYNIDLKIKDVLDILGNEKGFAATDRYSKDLIHNDLKILYDAYKARKLSNRLVKRIEDGEYYDFPDDAK